ncbi:MAG: acetylornithine transaminase [Zetaproteobacteria bacterium CG_4_9_14_3_um_filter_49_83]|nr:MAG: acetylornithine transaminase [Zetaproteobacteria bacterium CG1_02_49_23]PIQ33195.1 MAG: acetylornithine transaminase [Zetaproteobacteria bacterium CG17_big_fil_post_rev_8_21_14_2_50_50_13]PIV31657.1 MAG: acetylornithine transaminase [Zetaproteobacteria bacterium CG02_land_8_20_14_3_00_50_9]PIY54952.1 MAG: acetylornithine transaminase [Zetaproteobacteria bacterium CG_4_10_14_0_8_um_filter_49_80]PJA35303.1 MAG: acetylornithine transaminase [Zetaproteobacteria bacterium CG_4_9_14_3_um_filt
MKNNLNNVRNNWGDYINPHPAVMVVAKRPEITFVKGKGSWLWDNTGKAYLDFVQGWAVNCLGHSPDILLEAITRQASELIHAGPGFFNAPMLQLSDALVAHSCFDQVFFTNSGAEANEGAIKLARKWGSVHKQGAYEMITLQNGFHGRTLATMSASGKAEWESLYAPKVSGFVKVPQNDIDAMRAAINNNTVAIMLEPIQGESGVHPASHAYLQGVRELADEHGVLLIFDEVQTGMGRTGTLFAYEQSGVQPDVMTLGKGLGGGVPLGAMLIKKEFACFEPGDQGGTFNGNPLMTAAGFAILNALVAPGFPEQVKAKGAMLAEGLQTLSARYGLGEVRGCGLLLALDCAAIAAAEVVDQMFSLGALVNAPRAHTLRFMPALNVQKSDIEHFLSMLEQAFASVIEKHAVKGECA